MVMMQSGDDAESAWADSRRSRDGFPIGGEHCYATAAPAKRRTEEAHPHASHHIESRQPKLQSASIRSLPSSRCIYFPPNPALPSPRRGAVRLAGNFSRLAPYRCNAAPNPYADPFPSSSKHSERTTPSFNHVAAPNTTPSPSWPVDSRLYCHCFECIHRSAASLALTGVSR